MKAEETQARDDGGAAFPVTGSVHGHTSGMTLRDYFAGKTADGTRNEGAK